MGIIGTFIGKISVLSVRDLLFTFLLRGHFKIQFVRNSVRIHNYELYSFLKLKPFQLKLWNFHLKFHQKFHFKCILVTECGRRKIWFVHRSFLESYLWKESFFFIKRSLIVLPYSFELSHCEHTIVDKVCAFNPSHNSKMSLFKVLRNQMSLSSQTK